MTWPYGETVIHQKAGAPTTDGDGNDVDGFTPEQVDGVAIYSLTGQEILERGGDQALAYLRLVFKGARAISHRDEFVARGHTWTVDRPSDDYHSPLTGTDVVSVVVKRVIG